MGFVQDEKGVCVFICRLFKIIFAMSSWADLDRFGEGGVTKKRRAK